MNVDARLARRVEGVLARAAAGVARVRTVQDPTSGAGAQAWVGGWLVSTGRDGYVNRGIGGAIVRPATDADLTAAVRFFRERGRPAEVELCPYTDGSLVTALDARGVRRAWSRGVLVRELAAGTEAEPDVGAAVHVVTDATVSRWQRVHRLGFDLRGAAARRSDAHAAAAHAAPGRTDLLVTVDGDDVAVASLTVLDGCAVLGGATTVPAWRGRGLQTLLVRDRLARAAAAGCDLAVVEADPGSGSERNLRRLGFELAYTKSGVVLLGTEAARALHHPSVAGASATADDVGSRPGPDEGEGRPP